LLCINTPSSVQITLFSIISGQMYRYCCKLYICSIYVIKVIQSLLIDSSDCIRLTALTQTYSADSSNRPELRQFILYNQDSSINSPCISIVWSLHILFSNCMPLYLPVSISSEVHHTLMLQMLTVVILKYLDCFLAHDRYHSQTLRKYFIWIVWHLEWVCCPIMICYDRSSWYVMIGHPDMLWYVMIW
jgi:hypothetical protein